MMTAYFFGAKTQPIFFCNSKKQACKSKTEFTNISQSIGGKIGGSHKCVFLVPVHLKSFTISVLQFQQKNIVHLLDTYIFTQRRQFLKFVWCTIFRQNFKESKISTPISRKKIVTSSFGFVCFLKDSKVFMFSKVILILLELMQSPVQLDSWSNQVPNGRSQGIIIALCSVITNIGKPLLGRDVLVKSTVACFLYWQQ